MLYCIHFDHHCIQGHGLNEGTTDYRCHAVLAASTMDVGGHGMGGHGCPNRFTTESDDRCVFGVAIAFLVI